MIKETLLPASEFVERRQKFIAQMNDNSVAFFSAGHEVTRSNDTEYPFCQDKTFYYLTGFNEPDAVVVFIKGNNLNESKTVIFCLEKDELVEVWHGKRIGYQRAKSEYIFDESYELNQLDTLAASFLENIETVYFCQGKSESFDQRVFKWQANVKAKARQGISSPETIINCQSIVDDMRLFKSAAELDIMRKVNGISGEAHQRAMEKTKHGLFEYQIEAEILHEFARKGARFPAYNSIVAGGDNANILHYTSNQDTLNNGELLLIDAGGELAGYAADITRTFPVSGKFSEPQKQLYQLVLDAQELAIKAIKPKITLAQLNLLVADYLTQGLIELGIFKGNSEELIADKACKKYFIHGLGHWLGLDVHDVGDYKVIDKQQTRLFEPGMVMTIEPGLYIPLHDESVDEKWRGIGIRIEDNVLVTDQGHENLTVNAPKSVAEIEAIMAKSA